MIAMADEVIEGIENQIHTMEGMLYTDDTRSTHLCFGTAQTCTTVESERVGAVYCLKRW